MPTSLHNHSYYSILDSIISPKQLIDQAKDFGYNSIEGYKYAKEQGLKYIPASEIYETDDINIKTKDSPRYHLLLLAKSYEGYINLNKIVSAGYLDGFYKKMRCDKQNILQYHSKDIVCLSGCMAGRINKLLMNDSFEMAKEYINYYNIFDNYYLELQNHQTADQETLNKKIIKLAEVTGTPFVVTFDSHMLNKNQIPIHQKFIKIAQDREVGESYEGCFQVDPDTLYKMLKSQIGSDYAKEAIKNTDVISNMCNFNIELNQNLMPHIEIPSEYKNDTDYLKQLVNQGWKEKGFNNLPKEEKDIYLKRIRHEIEILDYLGYSSYFIMLKNYLTEARNKKIPLGPSRGSGANCLILYLIGITSVDSIKWGLDFERFGNKGRLGSLADYDIDVSKDRREEMLQIAINMFGENNVAQMATFNSLSAKVCIKDLGKVFDEEGVYCLPYQERENIAKLVSDKIKNEKVKIEEILKESKELRKYEEKYPLLFEYTKVLQNIPKSVGCHAAAISITDKPLLNYCAVMNNQNGNKMIQLSMDSAMDDLGIVKMDVLGIKNLDVIENTLNFINLTWDDVDVTKLDLNDNNVYDKVYKNGHTLGIFQMESPEAVQMCINCKCDNIEEVIAINAFNRPGTKSMFPDYVYNKFHEDKKNLIHEELKDITVNANYVLLYQEHFLKIFELAGFPEDIRDQARKAIGKKIPEKMKALEKDLKEGLLKREWTQNQVDEMWELILKQSEYSFNRGHSVGYGLLSYITAWLKTYYPIQFMTALMISEKGNFQQIAKYIVECERLNIKVLSPSINKSNSDFTYEGDEILFGLSYIKNVGDEKVKVIIENRPYISLDNFIKINNLDSSTIISLIKSGAFDELNSNREELLLEYANTLFVPLVFKENKTINKKQKELLEKENYILEKDFKDNTLCLQKYNEYKENENNIKNNLKYDKLISEFKEKYLTEDKADWEYSVLSIYLTGDPYKDIKDKISSYDDLPVNIDSFIVGTILEIKNKTDKNKNRYCYIDLINHENKVIECICWASAYAEFMNIIKKGNKIVIIGKKKDNRIFIKKLKLYNDWIDNYKKLNDI
jgi:DNA polymerase-3 subunit alpha